MEAMEQPRQIFEKHVNKKLKMQKNRGPSWQFFLENLDPTGSLVENLGGVP
jgi:hypothetical protein